MTARSDPSKRPAQRSAPWGGRPRVTDPKRRFIAVRCTDQQRADIDAAATRAGLSIGAFLRTVALGTPGPRAARRPPVELAELARLLGQIGKLGSNVNQLAAHSNRSQDGLALVELRLMRRDLAVLRIATLNALGRQP